MRIITFRVYDKDKGKMYYGDIIATFHANGIGAVSVSDENDLYFPEDYGISQFTGLYDMNGKKIYEGDIVKHHTDLKGFGFTGVVVFEDGGFWIRNKEDKVALYSWCNDVEVIGNIYENKDLLEKEGLI